ERDRPLLERGVATLWDEKVLLPAARADPLAVPRRRAHRKQVGLERPGLLCRSIDGEVQDRIRDGVERVVVIDRAVSGDDPAPQKRGGGPGGTPPNLRVAR